MNVTITPLFVDTETTGKMLGVSKSTIEKLTRERKETGFPPIRKISAKCTGYRVSEIEAWAAERPVSDLLPPPRTSEGGNKSQRNAANRENSEQAQLAEVQREARHRPLCYAGFTEKEI